MVGIKAMFAEYSGQDLDWFQLAFAFEALTRERNERQRYRDWRRGANPERRKKCREYQRRYEQKPRAIELRRARQRAYQARRRMERKANQ